MRPKLVLRAGHWTVLSMARSGALLDECMLFAHRLNCKKELDALLSQESRVGE